MHAIAMLQKSLRKTLVTMHAARVQVLLGAVTALLIGRRLVLMDLARSWPGAIRVRAPLKRLDRLLSNRHLGEERTQLYAAMARVLLYTARPIILVDWSALDHRGCWQLLRAAVPIGGRTLTIFESVHPTAELGSAKIERQLLSALKTMLPANCRAIIITDAGFCTPWFRAVRQCGWDYIGRVRSRIGVEATPGRWTSTSTLLAQATTQPTRFDHVQLTRGSRWPCHLVLARQRHHGRQLLTQHRRPQRNKRALAAQRRGHTPCLLATSLTLRPNKIVNLYRLRMQIEESFRDLKCERFGCAFHHSLTRKPHRIAILLLLQALASFLAYLVARQLDERSAQIIYGGIVGSRRHFSMHRIAWEVIRKGPIPIPLRPPHRHTPESAVAFTP
jgi:hypothetical protein